MRKFDWNVTLVDDEDELLVENWRLQLNSHVSSYTVLGKRKNANKILQPN